jgi:hypothetical protein
VELDGDALVHNLHDSQMCRTCATCTCTAAPRSYTCTSFNWGYSKHLPVPPPVLVLVLAFALVVVAHNVCIPRRGLHRGLDIRGSRKEAQLGESPISEPKVHLCTGMCTQVR